MADDIVFDCPACGKILIVETSGRGLKVTCPQCQSKILVPEGDAPASIADDTNKVSGSAAKASSPTAAVVQAPPQVSPAKGGAAPAASPAAGAGTYVTKFNPSSLESWDEEKLQARLKELEHLLKENWSQRTETTEYISHANLKLQRETLKLRKLEERKVDFDAELGAIKSRLGVS